MAEPSEELTLRLGVCRRLVRKEIQQSVEYHIPGPMELFLIFDGHLSNLGGHIQLINLSSAIGEATKPERVNLSTCPASVEVDNVVLREDEPMVFHLTRPQASKNRLGPTR
jgi:hypothetical protein